MLIFFFMIFNLLSFVYCVFKYGIESTSSAKIWSIYLLFHIISLVINGNISTVPYWLISLAILYMPSIIVRVFKPTIFICIGIFFAVGVFFQYLFPDLYNTFVFPLFINSAADFIESSITNEFGFSGFSPQTGTTAYLLLISQSVLLAFRYEDSIFEKGILRLIILILFVLAIFLTGKRMPSMISVALLLSSFFINKYRNKTLNIIILLLLFSLCYLFFSYFTEHMNQFSDNMFVKRFVSSLNSASTGDDITSGRSDLYKRAWLLFSQEPIIGIGAGNFKEIGNMGTSVHNTYLQVLCEEGILRFPFFIIPLLTIFVKTIDKLRKMNQIKMKGFLILSLFIQFVFILYSFTGNTIENNNNFVLYFMSVSFYAYISNKKINHF